MSNLKKIEPLIDEFERRFYDIPFGNSAFQNIKFILESQYTPERGYRAVGLRLADRIGALKEASYSLELLEIDIDELEHLLNDGITDEFERRRKAVELRRKKSSVNYTMKLVNDAVHECLTLMNSIKEFPEITRKQFEAGEMKHFIISLDRQNRGLSGAKGSLDLLVSSQELFSSNLEELKRKLIGK